MDTKKILATLRAVKPLLSEQYGVRSLGLFGSAARGDDTEDSDIDVLVDFNGPANSKQFFGVQFYLEDLLGRPVDLVTTKALRPELKPYIVKDLMHV